MIKYLYTEGQEPCEKEPLAVSLRGDRIISGHIHKVKGGYQYRSKKLNGAIVNTLSEVQSTLDELIPNEGS